MWTGYFSTIGKMEITLNASCYITPDLHDEIEVIVDVNNVDDGDEAEDEDDTSRCNGISHILF